MIMIRDIVTFLISELLSSIDHDMRTSWAFALTEALISVLKTDFSNLTIVKCYEKSSFPRIADDI